MIKIVTDSTADIPDALAQELGIAVAPALLEIDGNSYLDGVTLTREQFYRDLPTYRDFPKTAAVPIATFTDHYRAAQQAGADEIIGIFLSQKFSGTINAARIAAEAMGEEPQNAGLRIHVVESGTVSMGVGWQCIIAAQMAQQGADAATILQHLDDLAKRTIIYLLFDTLKYLRKGGRVSALTAGVGDLMQIKLLLEIRQGNLNQLDRVRLRARGLDRLVELAAAHGKTEHLSIAYTSSAHDKDLLALQERVAPLCAKPLTVYRVSPVLGAHFGPNGLGVVMVGV